MYPDPDPQHADFPHFPGMLYDCPACESECFCTDGTPCVYCAIQSETREEPAMTHTLPPLPTTNAELAAAVFPYPIDRDSHDWRNIHPACLLDHSQSFNSSLLTASIIRLAIALGMPPQEFACDMAPESHKSKSGTLLDHTMLEVLGMKADWWDDGQWLSEFALSNRVDECLDDMEQCALDWLNGCGHTDAVPPTPRTRCASPYRDTHHYETTEDWCLALVPNADHDLRGSE